MHKLFQLIVQFFYYIRKNILWPFFLFQFHYFISDLESWSPNDYSNFYPGNYSKFPIPPSASAIQNAFKIYPTSREITCRTKLHRNFPPPRSFIPRIMNSRLSKFDKDRREREKNLETTKNLIRLLFSSCWTRIRAWLAPPWTATNSPRARNKLEKKRGRPLLCSNLLFL